MKNLKKNVLFLGMMVATLALSGCGNGGNSASTSSSKKPVTSSEVEDNRPEYTVKFVGADGAELSNTKIKAGDKIEKPADPTAPAGQKFYGWMNVKNGGQIWNFEDDTLGVIMEDVELKPLFVPASQNVQTFEAELCPDITERTGKDGTPGMDGVTYSGGQQGTGLIGRDYYDSEGKANEFGASGLYIRNESGVARYATAADLANPDTADSVFGGFVHYNYVNGNTLTWELESDAAATNVTIFMSLSGEYGLNEAFQAFEGTGEDRVFEKYNDKTFKVEVNDEALEYGEQTIHNIIPKTFIRFQDYLLSATVNLKAGKNVIKMTVNNTDTLNGTIASTAPVVDCIKVFSSSNITWQKAKLSQMDKAGTDKQ